ncbi:MAG: hypothetical protein HC904_15755 [Blastochloris sp.]|nr:hypothetical protein [Blastochloris sp.]
MNSFKIKNLELASPLMLSPMAGFTNLPFRVAVRSLGGLSIATTDLVNARSLLELNPKAIKMVSACSSDRPLGGATSLDPTKRSCGMRRGFWRIWGLI